MILLRQCAKICCNKVVIRCYFSLKIKIMPFILFITRNNLKLGFQLKKKCTTYQSF